MLIELRAPIICAIIIAYILYKYNKEIHLNIKSTNVFNGLLVSSLSTLILDLITEYAINIDRNIFNATFIDNLQALSLISLFFACYSIYAYMLSYIELSQQKECKFEKTANKIASSIAIILIFFLPIKYTKINGVMCLDGPKMIAVYTIISYLMFFEITHLIKDKKYIPKEQYRSICLSALIFISVAITQMLFPYLLISGMGLTLEVVVLYLSLESPEKYIDREQKLFNISGLLYVLKEKAFLNKNEKLFLYAFNYTNSEEHTYTLTKYIYTLANTAHLPLYKINDNIYAIVSETNILKDMTLSITSCPLKIEGVDIMEDKIKHFIADNLNKEIYIDKMTNVFNRNKYEKDIADNLKENSWYIIADINNLKKVNDTLGHDKGDELIKDFVHLLKKAFSDESIYRIGGDEFAIISEHAVKDKIAALKNITLKFNLENNKNIEYAIGCEKYNKETTWEEIIKKADSNMYENKKSVKAEKK